ncbi:hypothetical protein TanjilG_11598 [Lupinus angustifolius]|uniref:WRKY domain-containing protein n=1 Tax=Lupinus angustifolius TaxID=3871 RepID=A0A1J7HJT2_LUPAN|nr:PREDICTED: WRKY transcription factor 22-like [Lupinus angustifolius]OIW02005.1 hypothetical protein TanjilG_11598 [Lupinus angustifolius]
MEQDWDLYAVVRGCSTTTSTTVTTTTSSSVSSSTFGNCYKPAASSSCGFFSILPISENQSCQSLSFSNPFDAKSSSIEELHDLCKPFFLKSPSTSSFQPSSPLSSFSYSSSSPKSTHTQKKQKPHHHAGSGSATTPRSKIRKNQLKKVCEVAAENLSSDIWAWRKYGQKPIKGSPYPRGYYRCSSFKGCLARKQVERNKSEPSMFIVTYTGEHNHPAPTHRNSLAGSTRQKPQAATGEESDKMCAKTTSPETSEAEEEVEFAHQSVTKSESKEDIEDLMNDDEEENEFGLPDMVLSDDFFEGLDELTGPIEAAPTSGVCFGDPFTASVALPT